MFLEICGGYEDVNALTTDIIAEIKNYNIRNVRFYNDNNNHNYINSLIEVNKKIKELIPNAQTQAVINDDVFTVDNILELDSENILIIANVSRSKMNNNIISSINSRFGRNIFHGAYVGYESYDETLLLDVISLFNEICEAPFFVFSEINSLDKTDMSYLNYNQEISSIVRDNTYLAIENHKYTNFKIVDKVRIGECRFTINGQDTNSFLLITYKEDGTNIVAGIRFKQLLNNITYSVINNSDNSIIAEYLLNSLRNVFFNLDNTEIKYFTYDTLQRRI